MNTFSSAPTSHKIFNNSLSTRWLANPNQGHSHLSQNFEAHMNVLFIIKVNITPICLEQMSFSCPFLNPHLITDHSNIGTKQKASTYKSKNPIKCELKQTWGNASRRIPAASMTRATSARSKQFLLHALAAEYHRKSACSELWAAY